MTSPPQAPYPKCPIVESVIDLQVKGSATTAAQEKIAHKLRDGYPHSSPVNTVNIDVDTTGGKVGVKQELQGFHLNSPDQLDKILLRSNGIAAVRLAPYQGWEHLYERSRIAYDAWARFTELKQVDRIGVRYINRIDVPTQKGAPIDFAKILQFYPQVPNQLSGKPLAGYMAQAQLVLDDDWRAQLTSAVVSPPPLVDHVSLLLDIDVFRRVGADVDLKSLWETVSAARALKNHVFENCIKDGARRLFA